jgi:hypothetical protein
LDVTVQRFQPIHDFIRFLDSHLAAAQNCTICQPLGRKPAHVVQSCMLLGLSEIDDRLTPLVAGTQHGNPIGLALSHRHDPAQILHDSVHPLTVRCDGVPAYAQVAALCTLQNVVTRTQQSITLSHPDHQGVWAEKVMICQCPSLHRTST